MQERLPKEPPMLVLLLAVSLAMVSCNYGRTLCKNRQADAFADLGEAAAEMKSYKAIHGSFPTSIEELEEAGFEAESPYYHYEIEDVEEDDFRIRAVGFSKMKGDEWVVDKDGVPAEVHDVCE